MLGKRGEIEDDGFGDYSTGRYCWELGNVEVFNRKLVRDMLWEVES